MVTFLDMAGVRIYLSLGSNLGDRAANLQRAALELRDAGVNVLRSSSIYETEPVDFLEQPWFLNCVIEGETSHEPRRLLEELQAIERKLGSRKLVPRGPRIIDLDILFYNGAVIHEAGMQIPHPRLTERRFVLIPLAELVPEFRHPASGATAKEMLVAAADRSEVRIWNPPEKSEGL